MGKTFLYTEMQTAIPFEGFPWGAVNAELKGVPGLLRKTWLSGLGTNTVGGFYEFDTAEHALDFAHGQFAEQARRAGAASTTRLFDGEIVREASVDLRSPYFE
ncbi:YdhR family protein [Nocardia colli]|uniref:YdhR family protein n=1 Tax=Nocardia colli TaxID=2545717 RepID=A0A5N0EDK8_9NOCA|nr:YdhR family protein [Nocardia colli]KAA8886225.1 YdhR family protein [Nocardia colli]